MKPAALIYCPHPPEQIRIAYVRFNHINPPGWTLWHVTPPPDMPPPDSRNAIQRHLEQGPLWDVRCTHRDHLIDHPGGGGLTAQMSIATLQELAKDLDPNGQAELDRWSLPLLVLELGRRGR
jgi:hypothetical protein